MPNVWRRWVPAAAVVVVIAGVAIAVPAVANASVGLPAKTPAEVLTLAASSTTRAFSGTVEETSDLGLPSLPTSGNSPAAQSGLASDLALLTGANSLRVYVDGPDKARLQSLTSLAERDVILNGSDVWTYDSGTNAVSHAVLDASDHPVVPGGAPSPATSTPEGIAAAILAKLAPTSSVSVGSDVRVAGRPAYDLVLTPKVTDSLVGSVSIAVDAATGLPLRVDVAARGQQTPAVSIAFSSLDLSTPAASLFDFTPPAGAKVTQVVAPRDGVKHAGSTADKPAVSVTGRGWDAVVTATAAGSVGDLTKASEFGELTTAVPGGRVLHTSLFNILFTTDGRVVAGSVSVARLQEVATAP